MTPRLVSVLPGLGRLRIVHARRARVLKRRGEVVEFGGCNSNGRSWHFWHAARSPLETRAPA